MQLDLICDIQNTRHPVLLGYASSNTTAGAVTHSSHALSKDLNFSIEPSRRPTVMLQRRPVCNERLTRSNTCVQTSNPSNIVLGQSVIIEKNVCQKDTPLAIPFMLQDHMYAAPLLPH